MDDDDEQRPELTKFLYTLEKEQLISMLCDVATTFDTKAENYDEPTLAVCNSDYSEIRYSISDLQHGKVDGKTD